MYNLTLFDGTPLTDILPLESDGVDNLSIARQVLDITFSGGNPAFVLADDVTSRFPIGFSFEVFDSAYNGTYTVAATPTFGSGRTTIEVNEPLGISEFVIHGVSAADDYWHVLSNGNAACLFYPTSTFTVTGNAFPGANGTYTVVSSETREIDDVMDVVTGVSGTWTIVGNHISFYTPGVTFVIRGNGAGDGTYTVASSALDGSNTAITVTGEIPGSATTAGNCIPTPAFTKITVSPGSIPGGATATGVASPTAPISYAMSAPPAITPVSPGIYDITWRLAGDVSAKFVVGCSFAIKNNSFYDYQAFTITNVSFSLVTTHITTRVASAVTPTPDGSGQLLHPALAIPYGYIQYERPTAATSLQLIGRGSPYFNASTSWGNAVVNNAVFMTEHFSRDVPPCAPMNGQIWYDQTVSQHRAFTDTISKWNVTAVAPGTPGTFTIAGDETLNTALAIGQTIVLYNNTGLGSDSIEYVITNNTLNGGDTDLEVAVIDAPATADGVIYARESWNGLVTATIPVTGFVDMNNYPIINVEDIPAAHEYTVIPGDTAFDNDFQSNALNLRSANLIYVNVTGDTMTGDLTMDTGADIFMTNGIIQLNNASDISFPVGSTGDILLSGGNNHILFQTGNVGNLSFQSGSTGDILLLGNNDITFEVGSTGNFNINGGNNIRFVSGSAGNIQFLVGSTGDITLAGSNDISFASGSTGNIAFLAGSTGDILLYNSNDISFQAASSGDIILAGGNDISFPVGSTGNVVLSAANNVSFPLGSTGGIALAGTNNITFTGVGQIAMGNNKIVGLGTCTTGTDAANKAYVDTYVSGIVYISPVKDPNVYNDALSVPPVTPLPYHRTYIVKPAAFTITGRTTGAGGIWKVSGSHVSKFVGTNTFVVDGNADGPSNGTYTVASAVLNGGDTDITVTGTIPAGATISGTIYHSEGAWNGKDGYAMAWDGVSWIDVLSRAVIPGDRFGIYAEPDNDEVPIDTAGMGATLIAQAGKIGTVQAGVVGPGYTVLGTAPAWSFYTPVEPDAFSVTGADSLHFGHAYTFRGTHGTGTYNQDHKWIEFCGPTAIIDGAGLQFTGNTLNIGQGNAITVSADTISVTTNPTLPGTSHVTLTAGTTGQRTGSPADAMIRFNTTDTKFEGYENGAWRYFVTSASPVVVGTIPTNELVYGTGTGLGSNPGLSVNPTSLSFQHAAGNFAVAGDAKTGQYVAKASTTDATVTEMLVNTTERLVLPNDSTWKFEVHVVARRTDVDGESAAYKFEGCIDRNANAASTALVGSVINTILAEDTVAWNVTVDADTTNGSLRVQVTGEAAKTIRWVAFIRTVEVTG
jgi:hypothetical protein